MPKGYFVSVEHNGKIFHLLHIGHHSDGGFFLQGLSSIDEPTFVGKVRTPQKLPFGEEVHLPIPKNSQWHSFRKAKLSHHIDGTAQISGSGIVSGFYHLSGKPKGIYVESINLRSPNHDGGPIFTLHTWGAENFLTGRSKNLITFSKNLMYDDALSSKQGILSYHIEGFYAPKWMLRYVSHSNGLLRYPHPNYGSVPTLVIPPHRNASGFLAISCSESAHEPHDGISHGFILGGAPGKIAPDGTAEQIFVIKPAIPSFLEGSKVLDLRITDKILFQTDRIVAKIRNFLNPNAKNQHLF